MKNVWKGIGIGVAVILLLMVGMYLALARYYVDEFSYNTWINGIYCTGKSIGEVNRELLQAYSYESLTVRDHEGNAYIINADTIGFSFDFKESLEVYKSNQNPYLWIDHFFRGNRERNLLPVIAYDESILEQEVDALPFMAEDESATDREVTIRKTSDGYHLFNERENILNRDMARRVIYEAVNRSEAEADLWEAGCYENLPLDARMERELILWSKIQAFQDCGIVYQMGEDQIPVDASVVCDWISLNETGGFLMDEEENLILDEGKVEAFVAELAEEYDTIGGPRAFQATRGEVVSVEGGTYGNRIDQEAETDWLIQAFLEGWEGIHEPVYAQRAFRQGKNDIGDTYIEIDMTMQMLYYYADGERVIETPVVTGNTSLRRGTPTGVNFIYAKERDRILRGEDYASPVDYWMPVRGAVGIHDASWRSEYGGEIYKTDGSHGCINTPYEEVVKLYEMAEIGTPCVMFY